jgi:hypothetical protein
VFPWQQGMPCGDMIASGKFSQPERLPLTTIVPVTAYYRINYVRDTVGLSRTREV